MSDNTYTIAAIEIGSSKINGLVAEVSSDGRRLRVLASNRMPISDSVRQGRIQNVLEISRDFTMMLRKLENSRGVAPRKIRGVYLGLDGRSLGTVDASASDNYPTCMEVGAGTLQNLCREATYGLASNKIILKTLPKRFILDGAEVKKVIGALCNRIRADYAAVVCSPSLKHNLESLHPDDDRQLEVGYIVTPVAMADVVLSESDRQLGVLLMDFGDQTVTLSAYKNGALQWLRTLPFGSGSITRDLKGVFNITEENAEKIKISRIKLPEGAERDSQTAEIDECVVARTSEIIANVINICEEEQVKLSELTNGIVLAGGGALMADFPELLEKQTRAKVRMATLNDQIEVAGLPDSAYPLVDVIGIASAAGKEPSVILCLREEEKEPTPSSDEMMDKNHRNNFNQSGYHREISEDDEDLLNDDEDDEEDKSSRPKRGKQKSSGGRFGKYHRKDNKAAGEIEETEDSDNPDDEIDNIDNPSGTINKWKVKFAKWFSSSPEDDLVDEEEGDGKGR